MMSRFLAISCLILSACISANPKRYSISDTAVPHNNHKVLFFENEPFKIDEDNSVTLDIAVPANKLHPPLALILHGNHSTKEAHRNQILALAKNGIAAIAMQFKNTGHWFENGGLLAKILPSLKRGFSIRRNRIASKAIVLIGHSFGGYAAAIAAGRFGKSHGVVLLDPAMYDSRGPAYISKISAPVVIIGADKDVFRSRKRDLFFEATNQKTIELSVIGATHDDAQNPSMFALSSYGVDPYTSRTTQAFITSLLVECVKALSTKSGLKAFQAKLSVLEKQSKISAVKIRHDSGEDSSESR